jgi:hypothetical protein
MPTDNDDFDFMEELAKSLDEPEYVKGSCWECNKEMYPEDDKYWGREVFASELCRVCRKKRGIEG